jgi:hypothetical protein
MKLLRSCLHVLLFLIGLFGTAAWLRSVDELPFLSWVRNKMTHVEERGGEYDTIFLGSSRMEYGVDPVLFDRRMAELGKPCRSFNLAFSGLRQHDIDVTVRWLVDHKPPSLRRVVIELHSFGQQVRVGDWYSDQEMDMHHVGQFLPRCRSVLIRNSSWTDKLAEFHFIVVHTLLNTLRIGQGQRILDDKLARARGQRVARVYDITNRGAGAVEKQTEVFMLEAHRRFDAEPERFTQVVRQRVKDPAPTGLKGGFNFPAIRAQAELLRAAGIEPIYVVMPSVSMDFVGRDGVAEFAREHRVIELDLPDRHRPLFERDYYYDPSHLNRAGVEVLSAYLANQLDAVDGLPIGQSPPANPLPARPLELRAERVAGESALRCLADHLPYLGTIAVVASTQEASVALDNGVRLGVAQPPTWVVELQRDGAATASGKLELGPAMPKEPVFLQLVVAHDGVVFGASAVLRVTLP